MNKLQQALAYQAKVEGKVAALMDMGAEERKDWFFRTDVIGVALAIRMVGVHNQYGCSDCNVEEYAAELAEAQEDVLAAAYVKVAQDTGIPAFEDMPS